MRRECETASDTLWRENLEKATSPVASLLALGVVALIVVVLTSIGA